MKLEELLTKKHASQGLFVIGDRQGKYYLGHYGVFSDTKPPKIYRNIGHAKNAVHGLAEQLYKRISPESIEHARVWKQYCTKEITYDECREATKNLRRWYALTKEQKQEFEDEHFEIIELELTDRKIKVKE